MFRLFLFHYSRWKLSVHTVVNITTNISTRGKSACEPRFLGSLCCWYCYLLMPAARTWSCARLFYFITHHQHWTAWICRVWSISGRKKTWFFLSFFLWLLLYSAILRSRADALRSHKILNELLAFYSAFLNIHRSSVLAALFGCYVAGATSVKLLSSRRVLRTPYNHAPFHVTSCKATYAGCMRVYL